MIERRGLYVGVEGLKELLADLKAMGEGVEDLKTANLDAAEIVAEYARVLVPVLTGALERSIRAAGQQKMAVVRAGAGGVPYAGPIHFGWPRRNIHPQPFIYDAADERIDAVIRAYEENIEHLMKQRNL